MRTYLIVFYSLLAITAVLSVPVAETKRPTTPGYETHSTAKPVIRLGRGDPEGKSEKCCGLEKRETDCCGIDDPAKCCGTKQQQELPKMKRDLRPAKTGNETSCCGKDRVARTLPETETDDAVTKQPSTTPNPLRVVRGYSSCCGSEPEPKVEQVKRESEPQVQTTTTKDQINVRSRRNACCGVENQQSQLCCGAEEPSKPPTQLVKRCANQTTPSPK